MSSYIPEFRRREKCGTCAFRSGTEPNRSPVTLIKAKLCADARIPFLCHEDTPNEVMCSGFTDLLESRIDDDLPDWKRDLAVTLLDAIEKVEEADTKGEPLPDLIELVTQQIKAG